jgi:alpha-glucosidase
MIYLNPYFANLTGSPDLRENQFEEGVQNGYFLKRADGSPYLLKSVSIDMAIVDLTNPDAWTWVKRIIKENLIEEAGAWGWMHDFGEYNPLDAVYHNGMDPLTAHNDYPHLWAKVVKEAIAESGVSHSDQIVPFMRSGNSLSPADTRLFWMGDQLPTWDGYDGLWSALTGNLNGGMSGYTMSHSDIGGYTTVTYGNFGYKRSKELLLRWAEMSCFSDMIMRTHQGVKPSQMYQIYDDQQTLAIYAYLVNVHVSLKKYKLSLMKFAEETGIAPTRPLMFEFPNDHEARKIHDQFMLGDSLMMAPILKKGTNSRSVYMPEGVWEHFFTKDIHDFSRNGGWLHNQHAPIGTPLVFVLKSQT